MQIIGINDPQREPAHVHTIDIWFSKRRKTWIVERLNEQGDVLGLSFSSSSEAEARHCLAEWLRAHGETYLASHGQKMPAHKQMPSPRRRAA